MDLRAFIRDVADFPKPGILFKDITPLLANAQALEAAISQFAEAFANERISQIAGIESRGFLFAVPLAIRLGCGFIPIRKPGKLPRACHEESYDLEYGTDRIHLHQDAATAKDRVLIVDDVLATGGTMGAAVKLVRRTGATVVSSAVLIHLKFLGGEQRIGCPVFSLLTYG